MAMNSEAQIHSIARIMVAELMHHVNKHAAPILPNSAMPIATSQGFGIGQCSLNKATSDILDNVDHGDAFGSPFAANVSLSTGNQSGAIFHENGLSFGDNGVPCVGNGQGTCDVYANPMPNANALVNVVPSVNQVGSLHDNILRRDNSVPGNNVVSCVNPLLDANLPSSSNVLNGNARDAQVNGMNPFNRTGPSGGAEFLNRNWLNVGGINILPAVNNSGVSGNVSRYSVGDKDSNVTTHVLTTNTVPIATSLEPITSREVGLEQRILTSVMPSANSCAHNLTLPNPPHVQHTNGGNRMHANLSHLNPSSNWLSVGDAGGSRPFNETSNNLGNVIRSDAVVISRRGSNVSSGHGLQRNVNPNANVVPQNGVVANNVRGVNVVGNGTVNPNTANIGMGSVMRGLNPSPISTHVQHNKDINLNNMCGVTRTNSGGLHVSNPLSELANTLGLHV